MGNDTHRETLPVSVQLAYGVADFGPSMAGNVLNVFFFFFLTSVANLPAHLAGIILLASNGWSALCTPIAGILCDRTQSRWGRRRVWMLGSAPVLALMFALHWWVPPMGEWGRFAYYLVVALLFQTATNGFLIPYGALVTDLTEDDRDRVRLNGWRYGFSLTGCIGALLLAQGMADWIGDPQRQLWVLGLVCAIAIVVSIGVCCARAAERFQPTPAEQVLNWSEAKKMLANRPLVMLVGIYALCWLGLQITPAILPYFVASYMELPAKAIATVVLVMQGTALVAMPIWEPLSRRLGKRVALWMGVSLWISAQLGWFYLHPGQVFAFYLLAAIAGFGMAVAYLVPPSMLPEVIDWDELHTGQRRGGLFYSFLVFLQKGTLGLGLFFVGQVLARSGFQETATWQPDSALFAIRLLMVYLPVLALLGSLVLTYFYPITRAVRQDTVSQLQQRRLATSISVN